MQPLYECKACLSCVQGCTKGLLSLSVNPEFLDMGDDYWKPDMILSTWNQADSGKIPVSGAGYRGPFHGPGFDSIWTDMSEIVAYTAFTAEYISTADIGPSHAAELLRRWEAAESAAPEELIPAIWIFRYGDPQPTWHGPALI
jgi:hypothetical protein